MRRELEDLGQMPERLNQWAAGLAGSQLCQRPRAGGFAFVEHVWHLSDLEREGYGERIRMLLAEAEPRLPDFEGERIARERNYLGRDLAQGLAAFSAARRTNLESLLALQDRQWERAGTQEGVGRVTLADLPRMIAAHDASHRSEIEELLREVKK
jgi:hypothetical protein